jgi:histidinol dehydrogenase
MQNILHNIKNQCLENGQTALLDFTREFDKENLETFVLKIPNNIELESELMEAIIIAKSNIFKFHKAEHDKLLSFEKDKIETSQGIVSWKKFTPIEKVGVYVPSQLFSSVLMNIIPAQIAGCKNITVCTPPNPSKEILFTLSLLGIEEIYTIGGAQAIFAMAYGIGEIPKVDKIFGPGNEFVDGAKKMVSSEVAVDMPAGPSEVLVISDGKNYESVLMDILAQLEHGRESKAWLFSTDEAIITRIENEIHNFAKNCKRWHILEHSIKNLTTKHFNSINEAIEESNAIAPEHLILNIANANDYLEKITNAGSVFIGGNTPESLGDYASGTNHVLPTSGFAKAFSGLCVLSFGKFITFQEASRDGISHIGKSVIAMAEAEGLEMHAKSVFVRI